jgi:hypothetical protein
MQHSAKSPTTADSLQNAARSTVFGRSRAIARFAPGIRPIAWFWRESAARLGHEPSENLEHAVGNGDDGRDEDDHQRHEAAELVLLVLHLMALLGALDRLAADFMTALAVRMGVFVERPLELCD